MPTEHLVETVRTQLLQLVVPELLEQLFQSQAHRESMDPVAVVVDTTARVELAELTLEMVAAMELAVVLALPILDPVVVEEVLEMVQAALADQV
jgi:hypothetical protein